MSGELQPVAPPPPPVDVIVEKIELAPEVPLPYPPGPGKPVVPPAPTVIG